MLKVKVKWAGFTGSPGYSNFFFDDGSGDLLSNAEAVAAVDKVRTFLTAVKPYLPNVVNLQIQTDVEHIHATNGDLFGVETVPAQASIVGTGGTGGYAASAGIVVTWHTGGVRNGRRVRGRTFLVPAAAGAYSTDGSLEGATHTALNTAAQAFAARTGDYGLGVWSRPSAPGVEDGEFHLASGARVPDMVAVLRSRRD